MSSDTQAVFSSGSVLESFQKIVERPVIKQETTRQEKIASLASSDAFKALQDVIDQWITNLRDIPIDPKTDTPESIGFRYLASKVTIEYLTDLKNMPDRYKALLIKK